MTTVDNFSPGIGSHSYAYRSKGGRKKGGRAREYKEELINTYDIVADSLHMRTTDLGKTFGVVDLYKDDEDPTDVDRIEKAFSKLESNAARVFQILDDAEKRGRSSVELDRSQLNCLRKFLFLIHYRNGVHARQFIEGHFDPLSANMVEEYRVKYNLPNTRAVWLRNVALLLEDEHWEAPADDRLLWTTRMDYKMEALNMQLGLYRAPPGAEFVLTENGLGLAEGASTPQSAMHNMMFPDAPRASYVTLTQSFPITPKLVIVLRSTVLSQEAVLVQNGMSPDEARRFIYGALGMSNTSYFHDFPRTQPRTTYIPPLPGDSYNWFKDPSRMTAEDRKKMSDYQERGILNGTPLHSRLRDRFIFAIDNLTQDQAERVNVLRLTHCKETISFMTPAALLQSLDAFQRDRALSREKKSRYASLKTKLLAEQLSSSPPAQSPVASTTASLPTLVEPRPAVSLPTPPVQSTTPVHDTLKTSLPSLKGALKGKGRATPDAQASGMAPSQASPSLPPGQTVVGGSVEPTIPAEIDATHPLRSSESLPGQDNEPELGRAVPPIITTDPKHPAGSDGVVSGCLPARRADSPELGMLDLSSGAVSLPSSAPVAPREHRERMGVTLPGLRGAFNRKPIADKPPNASASTHRFPDVSSARVSAVPAHHTPSTAVLSVERIAPEPVTELFPQPTAEDPSIDADPVKSDERSFTSTVSKSPDTTLETSIDLQEDIESDSCTQEIKLPRSIPIEEDAVKEDECEGDGLMTQMEEPPAAQDWDLPWWAIAVLGVVAVPLLLFGGRFIGGNAHHRR